MVTFSDQIVEDITRSRIVSAIKELVVCHLSIAFLPTESDTVTAGDFSYLVEG